VVTFTSFDQVASDEVCPHFSEGCPMIANLLPQNIQGPMVITDDTTTTILAGQDSEGFIASTLVLQASYTQGAGYFEVM
jgi:hypothetical protein